jgi:hypothetical protein
MEADWRQLDPIWFHGENRAFVICRELWTGRDRCIALRGRAPIPEELPLYQLSQPTFVEPPQPVSATDDRTGLLWRLSPEVWQPTKLADLLTMLDQLPAGQIGPIVDLGFDPKGGWLLAWR